MSWAAIVFAGILGITDLLNTSISLKVRFTTVVALNLGPETPWVVLKNTQAYPRSRAEQHQSRYSSLLRLPFLVGVTRLAARDHDELVDA
jgi:hypothetical protein